MTQNHHFNTKALAGLGLLAMLASPALAANLDVPDDFPTIQAAINAAANGDVIRIDPGTYNETLLINGKSLTLAGQGSQAFNVTVGNVGGTVLTIQNGADVEVESMRFRGGTTRGVLVSGSEATFDDVFIVDNEGNTGAGMNLSNGIVTVRDSIISNNVAANSGGAFYLGTDSDLTITGSWINGNQHSRGAIFLIDSSVTIDRCLFRDNDGTKASVMELSTESTATITNTLMHSNSGQFPLETASGSTIKMINATVADNDDTVAGLADNAGELLVSNTIARSEMLPMVFGGGLLDVRYSNISGGVPGPGNIDADPLFRNFPDAYHLNAGSPCIDSANGNAIGTDLDFADQPRFTDDFNITDAGVGSTTFLDMGAIERQRTLRYVKEGSSGDGLSWASPYGDLQDAFDDAAAGEADEIWVAAGVYVPDRGTGDRAATFAMRSNLRVFGGFAGTETLRDERDHVANNTALSGAIGASGIADNSYHVVTAINVADSGRLDGFNIRFGNASGGVDANDGGGIYIEGGAPRFRDIIVRNCQADQWGAAIYAEDTDAIFDRLTVRLNGTLSDPISALYFEFGSPVITNTVVHGNEVSSGSAIYFQETEGAELINSTVFGNTTGSWSGGVFAVFGTTLDVSNSIVWGNIALNPIDGQSLRQDNVYIPTATVRSTTIEGQTSTTNENNGIDPKFIDPIGPDGLIGTFDDDLRLASGSCLIDSGDNTLLPEYATEDQDVNPRFMDDAGTADTGNGTGPIVDRGAYEFQGTSCTADVTGDGVVGFDDLLSVLAAWGSCEGCAADLDCDGVVGFNDLLVVLAAWGLCP